MAVHSQRDYDRAIETAREAAEEARRENLPVVTTRRSPSMATGTYTKGNWPRRSQSCGRRSPSPNAPKAIGPWPPTACSWGRRCSCSTSMKRPWRLCSPPSPFTVRANNPSTLAMMSIKWGRAHNGKCEHEAIDAYCG